MHNPFKLNLVHRPRRLRRTAALRALVEDTVLRPSDLIAPLFVIEGKGRPEPVASMPGVYRLSIRDLVRECRTLRKLGILAVALFPKLDSRLKDEDGTAALREDALILRAVQAVKRALPEMIVMTDIALDPYTVHGHDGVLTPDGRDVDNDRTVGILANMAVLHACAGVALVARGDMMDGRVGRSAGRSMPRAARARQSWRTPQNSPRPITGLSAMRLEARVPPEREASTNGPTSSIPRTGGRPSPSLRSMRPRARTS